MALYSIPITWNADRMFWEVNPFAIFIYELYTKSTVITRSPKGKWYFLSRLKITKRVKSSNWKICVVLGAKVTTRTLAELRRFITSHHITSLVSWGDLDNYLSYQWHSVLLFDFPLGRDFCDVRYWFWFNTFSKRFAVDVRFLTFLQNQIQLKFKFNALLPQCFAEIVRLLRCDVIMYGTTGSALAPTYVMIVM
jgi:hypothetical protein